jgi:uncharacterized protein (UPF0332 family)
MLFKKEKYQELFKAFVKEKRIRYSNNFFKIRLFLQKAENSLLIAKHIKDIKPNEDQPKKLFWDYWAITISYYSMLYAAKAAILLKGYEVLDHDAAQIALGALLVPTEVKKRDLELLNKSHKIFKDEYVQYFEDAKKESKAARYSAIKPYTKRRLDEIYNNAVEFVKHIGFVLQDYLSK